MPRGLFISILGALCLLLAGPAFAYNTSQEARAAYEAAQSRVEAARSLAAQLRQQANRLQQKINQMQSQGPPGLAELDRKIGEQQSQLRQAMGDKITGMEEMRSGFFCSGCGRTRTEILAMGDQFPHPGQHVVNATPEQLEEKEKEFDQKIAEAKAALLASIQRRQELIERFRQELAAMSAPLADLLRQASEAEQQLARAASESARAKSEMGYLEQKERFIEAQKQEAEKQRQAKIVEEQKRKARAAAFETARWMAEKERLQREVVWRQQQQMIAQEIQDAAAARRRAEDVREAIARQDQAAQRLADAWAEEARQREQARQAAAAAPPATDAAPPDAGPPAGRPDSNSRASTQPTNRALAQPTDPVEDTRREIGRLDQGPGAPDAELAKGLREDTTAAASASDRLRQGVFDLAREGFQLGKEALRSEADARVQEKVDEVKDQLREDTKGLVPKSWLNAYYGSGKTPEQILTNSTSTALTEMRDDIMGGLTSKSSALKEMTNEGISAATTFVTDTVRNKILGAFNEKVFGIEDRSRSADPVERAETEYYNAVSPANLWLKTGFGYLRVPSIAGLRDYMMTAQDKFFNYFGLAVDRINETGDP